MQITVNCLDRHVAAGFGHRPAITFEADDGSSRTFTFNNVLEEVCAAAHVLQANGVKRGDRVSLCMPMIPQLMFMMLACARMGAIHSIIFAGFSAEAIADRIMNCRSDLVVTTDAGVRGGKIVPLKQTVDAAISLAETRGHHVRRVLVSHRAGDGGVPGTPGWNPKRDVSLDQGMQLLLNSNLL